MEGGELPDDIRLAEWAWPVRAGDVVAGVVMASHRDVAVIQIADFQASLTRADIEWTGLGRVDQVLPVGAVTLFRVLALPDAAARTRPRIALEQFPEVQGALVALDVRTGGVRAMVGGFDFRRSKFNRATQALRQVGSAFKPILYTAAIEKAGWTPITLLDDSPLRFAIAGQEDWAPRNYDRRFLGPVTLRRALELSRNIPAVRTLAALGIEAGIEYARKLGLNGPLPPYLPIALGAGEATVMEMTAAYATFPNQGLRPVPRLITQITDRDGNVIEEIRPDAVDAIRADTAYIMTGMLRGVVESGTAKRLKKLGRPIGGKNGHDERLDRRLVRRLRARARRRRLGRLRPKDVQPGPAAGRGSNGASDLAGLLAGGDTRHTDRSLHRPGQHRLRRDRRLGQACPEAPARKSPGGIRGRAASPRVRT